MLFSSPWSVISLCLTCGESKAYLSAGGKDTVFLFATLISRLLLSLSLGKCSLSLAS